ncbi:MAG: Rrf2 family transcriptional regulator [Desulfobacteraceae bacterium]|nr:Rrf2 family transcriptional regulator [Desulfobacteraceae bacterium]
MLIPSKKGQYALRAIYELSRRKDEGPIKISTIADVQVIPHRFLEVILNQFKGSGIVEAKRGVYGGYSLTRSPSQITVGDVLRYLQRDRDATACLACVSQKTCPFFDNCGFLKLWQKVKAAAFDIYDQTTMQDLLDSNETDIALKQAPVE